MHGSAKGLLSISLPRTRVNQGRRRRVEAYRSSGPLSPSEEFAVRTERHAVVLDAACLPIIRNCGGNYNHNTSDGLERFMPRFLEVICNYLKIAIIAQKQCEMTLLPRPLGAAWFDLADLSKPV